MGRLLFCLIFCKKIFFLFAFFIVFALHGNLFVYLENLLSCFPITIITTSKAPVEQVLDTVKVCSLSVQSERMTFDSSIFNHYETLPVKEIYLYSMKIPYSDWSGIKNMDDVITEANPYLEEVVSFYSASKIKCWLFSFIFITLLGAYFVFKFVASNKMSTRQFLLVSILISMLYILCSIILLCVFPSFLMPLNATAAGVLFMAYLVMTLINYKLLKRC